MLLAFRSVTPLHSPAQRFREAEWKTAFEQESQKTCAPFERVQTSDGKGERVRLQKKTAAVTRRKPTLAGIALEWSTGKQTPVKRLP